VSRSPKRFESSRIILESTTSITMNQIEIDNLHKQLNCQYSKLAASQAKLVLARKHLYGLRTARRDTLRSTTNPETVEKEKCLIDRLEQELLNVNNDLATSMEEVEEVKRETVTLVNTSRNCKGIQTPVVEELAPRNDIRRAALRAEFAGQLKRIHLVRSSKIDEDLDIQR
jgi:hypothetical protein